MYYANHYPPKNPGLSETQPDRVFPGVARVLQMTPANARHHLGILAADGRVEVISQRQGGRGRPEKVYRLAGTLVGDNLSVLADALLTEADENGQDGSGGEAYCRRARSFRSAIDAQAGVHS